MKEFNRLKSVALLKLYGLDRFYYNVAARLNIEQVPELEGKLEHVKGYTDGANIFLTPKWNEATEEERIQTLTHEVLHVISKHKQRTRGMKDHNESLMNVAADLSIADLQMELGQTPEIADIAKDVPDWKKYLNMDMFDIYNDLPPEAEQHDPGNPSMGDGEQGGQGQPDEDDSEGKDNEGDGNNTGSGSGMGQPTPEQEYEVDQAIQQAAVQADTEGYSTAASKAANRQVQAMQVKQIPWDQFLVATLAKLKSDLTSWARPNRRMMSQCYLPSRQQKEVFDVTVAMDVSGSVGETALNKIAAVAQDILTRYCTELHLLTFDDKIVDEWRLTRRDKLVDLQLNGYGGTYVQKVYDHLDKTKQIPKILVIATDGYIPETKDPGYPVIWLIVDNPTFKASYGRIIHLAT